MIRGTNTNQTGPVRTVAVARAIQERLAGSVTGTDQIGPVHLVAGIDVGPARDSDRIQGAIVVLSYPDLMVVEETVAQRKADFPYVPGYLSFREIPVVLDAFEHLRTAPDLVICDGQGLAHPRRFGLACHLGVLLDIASIGAAKTRLIGTHDDPLVAKGSTAPLMDRGEVIGAALRTRAGVRPLYVSIGHRLSLETAVGFVLGCCTRYRLPETTRAAHRLASGARTGS